MPRELERAVKVEAGHRCAIPACRQTPVEIAHIESYAKVREHTFENLIALCPTCHARYDREEIDRLSMRRYKDNLALLNSRYTGLERRVLEAAAESDEPPRIQLPSGMNILLRYAERDGLVEHIEYTGPPAFVQGLPTMTEYVVTPKGVALAKRLAAGEEIDANGESTAGEGS